MDSCTVNHLSHKLEFSLKKLQKLPAKISDRTSWRFLLPGIFFGALLFLLGLYEMLNGFRYSNPNVAEIIPTEAMPTYQPVVTPIFFDVIFMVVGFGMILASIFSYIRYRKFIFDGKTMLIGDRPVFGAKRIVKENLKNYQGVRFRIAFYQSGLINSNKYIIELYHKDPCKIVPLYISTSPENVRKKWKEFARFFKMPALVNTDAGLQSIDLKNLNKSIKEMAKLGHVVDNYDSYEELPDGIRYVRKKDKIVLKARKIVWDAYNILAWGMITAMALCLIVAAVNFEAFRNNFASTFYGLTAIAVLIIIVAIFILFRKEKLVLKKDKIVNTHKYMLFSTKHDEIMKNDIEAIEVTENPATGRFFVSIISDAKTITFGAKLPIASLRWIKRFLIHEVIK